MYRAAEGMRQSAVHAEVFQVRDPAHDENEIDGAGAEDSIGKVDVAAGGVMGFGKRRAGGEGFEGGIASVVADRGDEAITAPGAGFDVKRSFGGIAERAADIGNLHRERVVIDEGIGPKRGKEFVAAADIRRPVCQIGEQIERLGSEHDFG